MPHFSLGILFVLQNFRDENFLNILDTLSKHGLSAWRVMKEHYSQSHLCQLRWCLPAAHSTCFYQRLCPSAFSIPITSVIHLKHQFQLAIWILLNLSTHYASHIIPGSSSFGMDLPMALNMDSLVWYIYLISLCKCALWCRSSVIAIFKLFHLWNALVGKGARKYASFSSTATVSHISCHSS